MQYKDNIDTVLYHSFCSDGQVSAWCFSQFSKRWQEQGIFTENEDGTRTYLINLIPVKHNFSYDDIKDHIEGKNVVMVDIAPNSTELFERITENANYFILLDHISQLKNLLSMKMYI